MNRREFSKYVAALAVTPALPMAVPASAGIVGGAEMARHPAHLAASVMARTQNQCSPAMLARRFGLDEATAQALFGSLRSEGILAAPNASGVSAALKPFGSTLRSHAGRSLVAEAATKAESASDEALKLSDQLDEVRFEPEEAEADPAAAPEQTAEAPVTDEKPGHEARVDPFQQG